MNRKVIEALSELYEILLRFFAFSAVAYGATTVMVQTAPPLTQVLWLVVQHWVYGLMVVSLALVITTPFFAPEAVVLTMLRFEIAIGELPLGMLNFFGIELPEEKAVRMGLKTSRIEDYEGPLVSGETLGELLCGKEPAMRYELVRRGDKFVEQGVIDSETVE